jgi:hypothetical protein
MQQRLDHLGSRRYDVAGIAERTFQPARISGWFDDFNPAASGRFLISNSPTGRW